MIAVRDHLDQFDDALPVVITFTDDPTRLAAYRAHLESRSPSSATSIGPSTACSEPDAVRCDRSGRQAP